MIVDDDPEIVDIREHFVLEIEDTLEIAQFLGIKHPSDYRKREYVYMTTDLVITKYYSDQIVNQAVNVMHSSKLENRRTKEKLEIEKAYWKNRGIDLSIITEKDIPRTLIQNIKFYRNALEPGKKYENLLQRLKKEILSSSQTINQFIKDFSIQNEMSEKLVLELFKTLLKRHELHLKKNVCIDMERCFQDEHGEINIL